MIIVIENRKKYATVRDAEKISNKYNMKSVLHYERKMLRGFI